MSERGFFLVRLQRLAGPPRPIDVAGPFASRGEALAWRQQHQLRDTTVDER